jgi:hypothetical protein
MPLRRQTTQIPSGAQSQSHTAVLCLNPFREQSFLHWPADLLDSTEFASFWSPCRAY